jgi:hypothetical protein
LTVSEFLNFVSECGACFLSGFEIFFEGSDFSEGLGCFFCFLFLFCFELFLDAFGFVEGLFGVFKGAALVVDSGLEGEDCCAGGFEFWFFIGVFGKLNVLIAKQTKWTEVYH